MKISVVIYVIIDYNGEFLFYLKHEDIHDGVKLFKHNLYLCMKAFK